MPNTAMVGNTLVGDDIIKYALSGKFPVIKANLLRKGYLGDAVVARCNVANCDIKVPGNLTRCIMNMDNLPEPEKGETPTFRYFITNASDLYTEYDFSDKISQKSRDILKLVDIANSPTVNIFDTVIIVFYNQERDIITPQVFKAGSIFPEERIMAELSPMEGNELKRFVRDCNKWLADDQKQIELS